MAYRRGAVRSHRDEWRAEFYANSRPSTRRVPPQPPLSMQFQVRIAGPDVGRRVWPGGMGARDQAGNNAIDAAQTIEQKKNYPPLQAPTSGTQAPDAANTRQ